tara:strand:- start:13542 stop:16463 length:2922 start_codon:yes stop_codon:yes gene_type:complete
MGIGSSVEQTTKQFSQATSEASNNLSQTTTVNQSQINKTLQAVNLNNCDVSLSNDFNVNVVAQNRVKAQQITSASEDVLLNNRMAQKMLQAANDNATIQGPVGGIFTSGKVNFDFRANQVSALSNSIRNSILSTTSQYNESVQSFNCNGTTITARNLFVNLSASSEFISDTTAQNSLHANIENEITQTTDQRATVTNDFGISKAFENIMSYLTIALIIIAVIVALVVVLKVPGGAPSGKWSAPTLVVVIGVFLGIAYLLELPPMFNQLPDCSMSDRAGCAPIDECDPPMGWEGLRFKTLDYNDRVKVTQVPMRYTRPLTEQDEPGRAGFIRRAARAVASLYDPSSAKNENLLDMYLAGVASGDGSVQRNNSGLNKVLSDLTTDHEDYYVIDPVNANILLGDSSERPTYPILEGQVVPASAVALLSLSRNTLRNPVGDDRQSLFNPITDRHGRVASDKSENIALWSIARIGMPAPAAVVVPGVCCGDTPQGTPQELAKRIKIPYGYRRDEGEAKTSNQFNCCVPASLKVRTNGIVDYNVTTRSLNRILAGEPCNPPDPNKQALNADGFYNEKANFDSMLCPNFLQTFSGLFTDGNETCRNTVTFNATAFCDASARADSSASGATQTGFLFENNENPPDAQILATRDIEAIDRWLNCEPPPIPNPHLLPDFSILSIYNWGLDQGGPKSVAQEKRMRGLYLRFLLYHRMNVNVDLSVVSDPRELVTFTTNADNSGIARRVYATYVDLYDTTLSPLCESLESSDGAFETGQLPEGCTKCTTDSDCAVPPTKSWGCDNNTPGFCWKGTVNDCAYINTAMECAAAGGLGCEWRDFSNKDNNSSVCIFAYRFVGLEGNMEAPSIDNFGRNGGNLASLSGVVYGQLGLCHGAAYDQQYFFIGYPGVGLALVVLGLIIWSFISSLLSNAFRLAAAAGRAGFAVVNAGAQVTGAGAQVVGASARGLGYGAKSMGQTQSQVYNR